MNGFPTTNRITYKLNLDALRGIALIALKPSTIAIHVHRGEPV